MHELVEHGHRLDFNKLQQRQTAAARWPPWGLEVPAAADSVGRLLNEAIRADVESEPASSPPLLLITRWRSRTARPHRSIAGLVDTLRSCSSSGAGNGKRLQRA